METILDDRPSRLLTTKHLFSDFFTRVNKMKNDNSKMQQALKDIKYLQYIGYTNIIYDRIMDITCQTLEDINR